MYRFILSFAFLFCLQVYGQTQMDALHSRATDVLKQQESNAIRHPSFSFTYNPVKLAGNSLLWVYQRVFSEQIMAECGFEPSCSQFSKQSIRERGFVRGVLLTADRLMRCNAGAALETETYLLNAKSGKIYDVPSMYRIR